MGAVDEDGVDGHGSATASDADLLAAVRSGDPDAYGLLYERHADAARRLARALTSDRADAEDLVADAFAQVLATLRRGSGPESAFRAYLLTTLRHAHGLRLRGVDRVRPTDDLEALDRGVPFDDPAVVSFEHAAAAQAFGSLPERWQLVLWHTEVERQRAAEVAVLLGMSPASVSALAYRAREGLRQAYLARHLGTVQDERCSRTRSLLSAHVRGATSRRDARGVEDHLGQCRPCTALYLELRELNTSIAGVLAPALLGAGAAAYLAGGTAGPGLGLGIGLGTTVAGWWTALADRLRSLVGEHTAAAAAAGTAVTVAIGGALVVVEQQRDDPAPITRVVPGPIVEAADPLPWNGRRRARVVEAPVITRSLAPTPSADPTAAAAPVRSAPVRAPRSNLQVRATRTRAAFGFLYRVNVSVRGLAPGADAILTLDANRPIATFTLAPGCGYVGIGRARCRVTRTPAVLRFTVVPMPGRVTRLLVRATAPRARPDLTRVLLRR